MGSFKRFDVRKAARLALYEVTRIMQKKLQKQEISLMDVELGEMFSNLPVALNKLPNTNQNELSKVKSFFSYGNIRAIMYINMVTAF